MGKLLYFLLKTARPRQWLKNGVLFAPLVFSGLLFSPGYFIKVFEAFVLFCGLTSSVYIVNDIVDAPLDRKHPFKKKRPIASGDLPVPIAIFTVVTTLFIVLALAWALSFYFFIFCLIYLLLSFAYTGYLKQIPIIDLLVIATGFVLRVYAGAIVVNLHMNVWFLLAVISLALFLAVGKRQGERTLLTGLVGNLKGQRTTLSHYTTRLLDVYTALFAGMTLITYSLFAFQHQYELVGGPVPTFLASVPRTFLLSKWLMFTVPVVIYGVMRYLQLMYEKNEGESPERVLLGDKPLLLAVILWGIIVLIILYGVA